MKLWHNPASPFARKVRIVARETGFSARIPANGAMRWQALRLQALGDGILDAAVLSRYELAVRPRPLQWTEWLQGRQIKINGGLDA